MDFRPLVKKGLDRFGLLVGKGLSILTPASIAAMILVLLKTFYSGLKEPHCPLDVSKGHAALAANTTLRGASNVTVRAAAGWTRCAISCPAMMTRIMSVRPRAVSAPVISAPNDGGKPRNTSPLAK